MSAVADMIETGLELVLDFFTGVSSRAAAPATAENAGAEAECKRCRVKSYVDMASEAKSAGVQFVTYVTMHTDMGWAHLTERAGMIKHCRKCEK